MYASKGIAVASVDRACATMDGTRDKRRQECSNEFPHTRCSPLDLTMTIAANVLTASSDFGTLVSGIRSYQILNMPSICSRRAGSVEIWF